jgi:hypothetical protein
LTIFESVTFDLEGKWKLSEFTAFDVVLTSQMFTTATDDNQTKMIESMNFILENTFYHFKGDSINFTNAGGDNQLSHKKGKFLVKSDTLVIFQSDKVNALKFFITSYKEETFKMRVVYRDGSLGPSVMTFIKGK